MSAENMNDSENMNGSASPDLRNERDVIVVGAGPVGLFAALRLAQQGLDVLVVEAEAELGVLSKASTFHPATLDLLDEAGVASELVEQGVVIDEIQWRDLSGSILARVPFEILAGHTGFPHRLHAEQTLLTPILLDRLRAIDPGSVRFGSTCVGIEQDEERVTATIAGPEGDYVVTGRFLLGADGAHSAVRDQVGVEFPGSWYASRAMRVITTEDLRERLPDLAGIAYVRDERQSCSLLHMRDHWRFIFRITGASSDEEVLDPQAVRALVDAVAPGVTIELAEVYGNRVNVADRYVTGRVGLVGDAAHVTTTAGGMNMNCGLHDAYAMARAIAEVQAGAPLETFAAAGDARRDVVTKAIIPRTESRAAGADGNREALAESIARVSAMTLDPQASFTFLHQASMLDTTPSPWQDR